MYIADVTAIPQTRTILSRLHWGRPVIHV